MRTRPSSQLELVFDSCRLNYYACRPTFLNFRRSSVVIQRRLYKPAEPVTQFKNSGGDCIFFRAYIFRRGEHSHC